jgi:transposase
MASRSDRFINLPLMEINRESVRAHLGPDVDTSLLEGMNNNTKVIKRKDYGAHNVKYFAQKKKRAD